MPNNYVLLERIELNASAASVTFANIPQTGYTDLKVVVSARTDNANNTVYLGTEFNGVTTGYTARDLYGTGSAAASRVPTGTFAPVIPGSTSTANTFSNMEIYIPNYRSSDNKSYSADSVTENNGTTAFQAMTALLWSNTAAITSIKLTPELGSLVSGSTFSLYGLAALGTTPAIAPKASGGSIYSDGTYWYHAFRTSGTFTPQVGLTADVLVVAGGGGGGTSGSGGGGAGGLLGFTSQSLTTTAYTCTVGAGGAIGAVGVDSQFGSLTLVKGGGLGGSPSSSPQYIGGNGGSGGGAQGGYGTYSGGTATSGQGFNGGGGTATQAGSGGGAGAVGATGGAGGIGSSAYSSWGSATNTGQLSSGTYYYAGGGGGGGNAGGLGGGGNGTGTPVAGTTNTGGGGGGANGSSAGGSGLVIVRYTIA